MKKKPVVTVLLVVVIITVAIAGALNPALIPALSLVLLAGLVGVTTVYVYSTEEIAKASKEQADASLQMAEEMREQRHGAVRPIIDIRRDQERVRAYGEATVAASGQMPESLECQLRNIGLGPALDVSAVVCPPDEDCRQHLLGSIGVKDETDFYLLITKQKDGSRQILVSYFDVYGRRCESRQKVTLSTRGLELGHLEVEQFPWEVIKND